MISKETYQYIRNHKAFNSIPNIKQHMMNTQQSPKWHPEGCVWNHTVLVLDQAIKEGNTKFYDACLFHDVGKINTTNSIDGKITSYGHEFSSNRIYINAMPHEQYDLFTAEIVSNHMRTHLYKNGKMTRLEKRKAFEESKYYNDLLKFSEYDENGSDVGQHVILTIGISGSGKSTWVKNNCSGYDIVSPDKLRQQLTGHISDQSQNATVWDMVYEDVAYNLTMGKNVIVDSTMVKTKDRLQMVDWITQHNANVVYKIFDVDSETAYARIQADVMNGKNRSNTPREIVEKHEQNFKQSDFDKEDFLICWF